MEWILISDPPPYGEGVMLAGRGLGANGIAFGYRSSTDAQGDHFKAVYTDSSLDAASPTHWMRLPEAPSHSASPTQTVESVKA